MMSTNDVVLESPARPCEPANDGTTIMRVLHLLVDHDRDFAALRRAGRTAIVMPAMFALGARVIGDPDVSTFAAFGSFAMLLLVDFGGARPANGYRRRRPSGWPERCSSVWARWPRSGSGRPPRRWPSSASP
jgi:hypothetical protein